MNTRARTQTEITERLWSVYHMIAATVEEARRWPVKRLVYLRFNDKSKPPEAEYEEISREAYDTFIRVQLTLNGQYTLGFEAADAAGLKQQLVSSILRQPGRWDTISYDDGLFELRRGVVSAWETATPDDYSEFDTLEAAAEDFALGVAALVA